MLVGPWRLATGLADAGDHFSKAENKLSAGAMKEARYETLAGVAAAKRARAGLDAGGPLLELASKLPKVGPVLGEADHLVKAAEFSAVAALGTLDVAQNALRGPDKVIAKDPSDSEGGSLIRIDRLEEIGRTITDVREAIDSVGRELGAVDLKALPDRIRKKVTDGIDKATETDELLRKAEAGFKVLPGILGADGPRTYVIGFQNNAEERGAGGALLQFALMTIVDGKPELVKNASSIYDVDKDRQQVSIPLPDDAWYVQDIPDAQRFGNANWSPDWPLSADLTVRYAQASENTFPRQVDGVIAADPILMQDLMPGVGQFESDKFHVYVTSNRIVYFLLYKAYGAFPIPKVRRARLSDVVDSFFERMFKPHHPTELVDGFGSSFEGKHMQMWMSDPSEQAFVELMNWDGAIDEAKDSDYLYVVEQNVGGNKLDYFGRHATTMDIQFDGDDAAISTETAVTNGVFLPQPLYPMGDSGKRLETNGYHRPMMNVYVPDNAELTFADVKGSRLDTPPGIATWPDANTPATHSEKGKKVWSATLEIPPQETGKFSLGYRVPGAVRTEEGRRVYRLTVQHQPRVWPEQLTINLDLPAGVRDVRAPGWKRTGSTLVWDRPLTKDFVLEVSWQS
ncbi:MAG: hypothetical protein QOG54_2062 [Actinomycetota bacterium]|jgi:hypothetical protein|nr:hypothetical protein [Actinomycetota bacterium]